MLRNIKSFIWTAQIFGASIFKIRGRKLKISKKQIIYFTVLYILNTTHLMFAVYLTLNDDDLDLKKKFLSLTRTSLGFVCLTVDTVMTTTLRDHLKSALDCLHVYDTSSRFNLNYSKHGILVNRSQIAVITIIAWWSVVGFVALQINSASYSYFFAFSYVHFYSSISLQVFIFCGLMLLIHRRFNHLGRLAFVMGSTRLEIDGIERSPYNIELQDVWWSHSKLIDAAEKINHVYSMQILLWIFSFSLNCLSRIYTLMNDRYSDLFCISRDLLCLIGCFINVFVIIIACHLTGQKANQISKKLFSHTSNISMKTTSSRNAAMAYFFVNKLHFFGAYGLIRVHLPLLISIVGAMTTFLVLLHKH